jgi:hypothetical protein
MLPAAKPRSEFCNSHYCFSNANPTYANGPENHLFGAILQAGFSNGLLPLVRLNKTMPQSLRQRFGSLFRTERRHVPRILLSCGGNKAEAARGLGIAHTTRDRRV